MTSLSNMDDTDLLREVVRKRDRSLLVLLDIAEKDSLTWRQRGQLVSLISLERNRTGFEEERLNPRGIQLSKIISHIWGDGTLPADGQELLRETVEKWAMNLYPLLERVGIIPLTPEQREHLRSAVSDELITTGADDQGHHNERGVLLDGLIDYLGFVSVWE